ncbi:unnamed protein product [Adineta ricciae]|uniref:G-protein coupled receptors family 1 profile domain-containing protein n=1 Tax=Adineta ricciae TaxID=249248 RepID=A0A814LLW5_ADIRI|nr:unnamed protein product [Adineta ricciae]
MTSCAKINLTGVDHSYYQKFHHEKSWAWWLNHIGTFVVFIISFCGNLLCLLVLCRQRLKRNSYTQYLIALAIVDTGAILCEALKALDEVHQYQNADKRTLIQHTLMSCKFYYYIRYIFYSMSSWVTVALAVERLVAIKFPLWSKHICSVINARRILFLILLFTMMIQSYHLVIKGIDCKPSSSPFSQPTAAKSSCRCKTLPDYAAVEVILTVYLWRLCLMTLLPLTIIITVNILIMSKLFSGNSLNDHTNAVNNSRRKTVLLYKISRMLVIVSSIYLVLHVPGSSFEILKFMFLNPYRLCDTKWRYFMSIVHDIFDLITNFNYGINFYLYIISGQHIRTELFRTFRPAKFRSTINEQTAKFQRSSYFMSSYVHHSKNNQPNCSHLQLSNRLTGPSV